MRIRLLCALITLCAAQVAQAQQYPSYSNYGYPQQYPAYGNYGYPQQYLANNNYGYAQQNPAYGYNASGLQFAPDGQQGQGSAAYNAFSQGASPSGITGYNQATPYYGYNGYSPNGASYPAYPNAGSPYGYSPNPNAVPGQQNATDSAVINPQQNVPVPTTDGALAPPPAVGQPAYCDPGPGPDMLPGYPLTAGPAGYPGYQDGPDRPCRYPGDDFNRPTNEKCWASAEYIMSWFRPQNSAGPLVTTSSVADGGILGNPSTSVLLGNRPIDFGMFSGVRAEAGVFLDKCDNFSLDATGFYIFQNDTRFNLASDANGNPLIARPVTNANTGSQIAYLDAAPGLIVGGTSIVAKSELLGAEFNAVCHAYPGPCCELDGLIGFRYLRLAESLSFNDQFAPQIPGISSFLGQPVFPPDTLADMDSFQTSNNFYGLQLGARMKWESDWFSCAIFGKAGVGATDQEVRIAGSTTLFTPTGNVVANGGILALPTNIGVHDRTEFGWVSEAGVTFGVNVCKHLEVTATYSALYWNRVVRPSGEIDRNVNTALVPTDPNFGGTSTTARPFFNFNEEMFWAQSGSFGVVFHY
jgi:Putative beta barrel porin-7 (BBP7)